MGMLFKSLWEQPGEFYSGRQVLQAEARVKANQTSGFLPDFLGISPHWKSLPAYPLLMLSGKLNQGFSLLHLEGMFQLTLWYTISVFLEFPDSCELLTPQLLGYKHKASSKIQNFLKSSKFHIGEGFTVDLMTAAGLHILFIFLGTGGIC